MILFGIIVTQISNCECERNVEKILCICLGPHLLRKWSLALAELNGPLTTPHV